MKNVESDRAELELAKTTAENLIYKAALQVFEALEKQKMIAGNGHHIAQKFAANAAHEIEIRWIGKDHR